MYLSDYLPLLIVGGAILAAVVLAVYMLHRSWGDSLPRHIEIPQPDHTKNDRQSYDDAADTAPFAPSGENEDDPLFVEHAAEHPHPLPDEQVQQSVDHGLILITHPLLLQVIQRSLAEGGNATRYVVRDGEDLYVSLDLITDPMQRRQAAEMIHKYQAGSHPGAWDIIGMASIFGRGNTDG